MSKDGRNAEVELDRFTCKEINVDSSALEVPRNLYQRSFHPARAEKIAAHFDERIANDPKVSFRDGRYYVFDGQHTISARVLRNHGEDLPIKCRVYYGMSEQEEASLFCQQTGVSAKLTPGERLRALVCAKDEEALAFLDANEAVGLKIDYEQEKGERRVACIGMAFSEFRRVGEDVYKEAMAHIVAAWDGDPHSLRREIVQGVIRFVELYRGEYKPERLETRLSHVDPLTIYREGMAMGNSIGAGKRYLYQVFCIYNGKSKKKALPLKF